MTEQDIAEYLGITGQTQGKRADQVKPTPPTIEPQAERKELRCVLVWFVGDVD